MSKLSDESGSSGERQNSYGSTSTLRLCTPNFGLTHMVLPKPLALQQLHIPPPPSIPPSSYDYYEIPSDHHNYYSLNDCIDCLQSENVPIYATNRRPSSSMTMREAEYGIYGHGPATGPPPSIEPIYGTTPYHFGLDKKGLLQIDYSCNWNNLHRYISK